MEVIKTNSSLKKSISKIKPNSVGFVPTMGALHQGHMYLLESSVKNNDISVCSIFVNPAQFNDPDDLKGYPVTIEQDLLKLKEAGCDIVYLPDVNDVYPDGITNIEPYELGGFDKIVEGAFRPGHFQGVAKVVDRLLQFVGPCKLYLGQKDIQQFQVIKYMIASKRHNVELVMCDTIREDNGLALSSRNKHLENKERLELGIIYETLSWAAENIFEFGVDEIEESAHERLMECAHINNVEYFKILKFNDFVPVIKVSNSEALVICVALNTNKARLIDNILLFY